MQASFLTWNELRAGGWRGPESAEGAGPLHPPASAFHGAFAFFLTALLWWGAGGTNGGFCFFSVSLFCAA